ncbi:hypothetical protein D3C85_1387950 [compost metagenome]
MLGPDLWPGQVAGNDIVVRVGVQIHAPNLCAQRFVALEQRLADKSVGAGDEHRTGSLRLLPTGANGHGCLSHTKTSQRARGRRSECHSCR